MRLLFPGDSRIEFSARQTCFPEQAAVNTGRAGETVADLLARLARLP